MFDCLFGEEDSSSANGEADGTKPIPPPPRRPSCGLVGLKNQGATCYLNAFIQTLRMTPEFRESLFQLPEMELGHHMRSEKSFQHRVIPQCMRKLFSDLMLSNKDSVSTEELTASFGWKNNEQLDQHDVQELNQVLFSAIEDSLIDTSGSEIIGRIYRGRLINQILCTECGGLSQNEETFSDVTVCIQDTFSLEESLYNSFCINEEMSGDNKYYCSRCCHHVTAYKGAKLRSLPPILTVTLQRLTFNPNQKQRHKVTKNFAYPLELDMAQYMEKEQQGRECQYDLFSVVVHRGGAKFGHYHAYIKDVDGIGTWSSPRKGRKAKPPPAQPKSPTEALRMVLDRSKEKALPIHRLCSEFNRLFGSSWSKTYKSRWGTISKFVTENTKYFSYDLETHVVALKDPVNDGYPGMEYSKIKMEETMEFGDENTNARPSTSSENMASPNTPPLGQCWYDFNDSTVIPMETEEVLQNTQNRGTPYMLFYRSRSLHREPNIQSIPNLGVPLHLANEVWRENFRVEQEREAYQRLINEVKVEVHVADDYECLLGLLSPVMAEPGVILTLDQRQTLASLRTAITESCRHVVPDFTIHHMKRVESRMHLYEEIVGETSQLQDLGIKNQTMLFVWNGQTVKGERPNCGADSEPISLTILHGNYAQLSGAYAKNLTILELRSHVSRQTNIPFDQMVLKKVVGDKLIALMMDSHDVTLKDIPLQHGDQLVAQDELAEEMLSLMCKVIVRDCVSETYGKTVQPSLELSVQFECTVAELKALVLHKFGFDEQGIQTRLRGLHSSGGLKSLVEESQTVAQAGFSANSTIVLEPGVVPTSSQMLVVYALAGEDHEVLVERTQTVNQVLHQIIKEAGLPGKRWFLRKTDWCGDPGSALEDPDATLEDYEIYSGDRISLEMGSLPSKNCVILTVTLYPTHINVETYESNMLVDYLEVTLRDHVKKATADGNYYEARLALGTVEISKQATLQELKKEIMALPLLAALHPPFPLHLRVRRVEEGHLGGIFRGSDMTLSKLKITKSCQIAAQLLHEEENLGVQDLVLKLLQRVPGKRCYQAPVELVWRAPRLIEPMALRLQVAQALEVPEEFLLMARHFTAKHTWMEISGVCDEVPKRGKKGNVSVVNLRHAPFHLQDGCILGIKDLQNQIDGEDSIEDFSTEEDDRALEALHEQEETKRNLRWKRRQGTSEFGDGPQEKGTREKGLVIKIHPFL